MLGVFVTLGNLERRTERGGNGARDITLGFFILVMWEVRMAESVRAEENVVRGISR